MISNKLRAEPDSPFAGLTSAGKLMLQMCGAFAEFERSMLQARIAARLKRAVANGRTLGRPLNDRSAIDRARGELANASASIA